jgi:hypothetical protein
MNTQAEVKLPATTGIAFTVTPEQAMELIKNLASYAIDGKPFEVTVHTQSKSWNNETPVAVVSCGGFMRVDADLLWSYTGNGDNQVIHYDSTKVGA